MARTNVPSVLALTYREFREYHSEEEESRYDLFLRYNRIA